MCWADNPHGTIMAELFSPEWYAMRASLSGCTLLIHIPSLPAAASLSSDGHQFVQQIGVNLLGERPLHADGPAMPIV
jgi:hypothetical protein